MKNNATERETWWTRFMDLVRGVVHWAIDETANVLFDHENRILTLERKFMPPTDNEQKIMKAAQAIENAAQVVERATASFRAEQETQRRIIEDLRTKAPAAQSAEDLSDEFNAFNQSLSRMEEATAQLDSTATALNQAKPEVPSAPDNQNQTPITPPQITDVSPPNAPTSPTPLPNTGGSDTPLAGVTGPSNVPTDADNNPIEIKPGQVYAEQPQVGTEIPQSPNPNPAIVEQENNNPNLSASELTRNAQGSPLGTAGSPSDTQTSTGQQIGSVSSTTTESPTPAKETDDFD